MFKLLGLLIIAAVIYPLYRRKTARKPTSPRLKSTETVRCHHCGVYVPASEALHAGKYDYCCEEHRRADERH